MNYKYEIEVLYVDKFDSCHRITNEIVYIDDCWKELSLKVTENINEKLLVKEKQILSIIKENYGDIVHIKISLSNNLKQLKMIEYSCFRKRILKDDIDIITTHENLSQEDTMKLINKDLKEFKIFLRKKAEEMI